MSGHLSHLGKAFSGREVFLLELAGQDLRDWELKLPSPFFLCLLAWDATSVTVDAIGDFCQQLIDAGCCSVCCWGPDCERVHDIFDETDVARILTDSAVDDGPVILTTWHDDESLSSAIDFAVDLTPDGVYAQGCGCLVVITIDSPEWSAKVRRKFLPR